LISCGLITQLSNLRARFKCLKEGVRLHTITYQKLLKGGSLYIKNHTRKGKKNRKKTANPYCERRRSWGVFRFLETWVWDTNWDVEHVPKSRDKGTGCKKWTAVSEARASNEHVFMARVGYTQQYGSDNKINSIITHVNNTQFYYQTNFFFLIQHRCFFVMYLRLNIKG
jgi:hypothetical protein